MRLRWKQWLLLPLLFAPWVGAQAAEVPVSSLYKTITHPNVWLNTSRKLEPEDLRGRIVLLDFWTYACINCMHVIPDLHYLEKTFGLQLTVIGVHSAKFANERDTGNIRAAIVRDDIAHPVVNDSAFYVWKSFGVDSWPTFVLINPEGKVESTYSGEGNREKLSVDIQRLIKKYGTQINKAPLPLALEKNKEPPTVLQFPGKLITLKAPDGEFMLAISDSGHNRIVIAGMDGQIRSVIGSGEAGSRDGSFSEAQFRKPQGLAYADGVLYVADTENHLLRAATLATNRVVTLAGTGKQGYPESVHDADALKTPLSSPWDVTFYPDAGHLAIAMAGTHQIWSYDLKAKTVSAIAGSGHEDISDGAAPSAALAQTSGLAAYGGKLYFVDAETSSLRVVDDGRVKTLIGSGLFDFGYKEGKRGAGQMQHPLGLTADDSGIYVADAYNHSVRRFDLKTGVLSNFAGHGERGHADGTLKDASFNEPSGITRLKDVLYVADTNNHHIRTLNLKKGEAGTLDIREPEEAPPLSEDLPNVEHLGNVQVAAGRQVKVQLVLKPGWHINAEAPSYLVLYRIENDKPTLAGHFARPALETKEAELPLLKDGGEYRLQGTLYYCEEKAGSQCLIRSVDALLKPRAGSQQALKLHLK